jgi:signal transduction histidine kinase
MESSPVSSGRSPSAFTRLSLATKLLLLVLLPLAVVMGVTVALVINALGQLESDTSIARLQDEVAVISQQFARIVADLELRSTSLSRDPSIVDAIENDAAGINSFLLSTAIRANMSHLELVDADGSTVGRAQPDRITFTAGEIEKLHSLGLSGDRTTRLLPTGQGWALTVIQPVKTGGAVVGALSVSRLLNGRALSELNFNRADLLLMFFDSQGKVNAVAENSIEDELVQSATDDQRLWDRANKGQIVVGTTSIGGNRYRVAYAPLIAGGEQAGVFSLALSTEATAGLRDRLVLTNLLVIGLVTLLAVAADFLMISFIRGPIIKLSEAAVEIGEGKLDARVEVQTSDEVGDLATAFNRMADQVREATTTLEDRVRERTRELEEAQERLLRIERMAAVGEVAAAMAHELRNPLAGIKNAIFYVKTGLEKSGQGGGDPRIPEFLDLMEDEVEASNRIITELLDYSRVNPLSLSVAEVETLVDGAISESWIKKDVNIVKDIKPAIPEVWANLEQIHLAFLNLINNAGDAMPDGGTLTISAAAAGEFVEVRFKDTGEGIAEENLDRVLDPLFTTKEKGTGMGLALVSRIIERHDGVLDVASTLGSGATFTIKLHRKI